MNDSALPSSSRLKRAGELMTPTDPPPALDLSEVSELAAFDAACKIQRVQTKFREALQKIDDLQAAGLDRRAALGAGIDLATEAMQDTEYRESIFRACCEFFGLTANEANQCARRYRQMASAVKSTS